MINDNKLTECQICFERYNKNNKEPKILSCGHTFCKECLMKFQANVEEIICSICRKKECQNEAEKLPTNRVIYELLYQPMLDIYNEKDVPNFKIILIGHAFTGKSSLIRQYIYKQFSEKYNVTIGLDFDNKKIKIDNRILNMQIWDTAGTEIYQSLMSSYIRNSNVAIIVFDISNRESFDQCKYWIDIYRQYQNKKAKEFIYLVGNKIDLSKEVRVVSYEEGQNFCINNKVRDYFEVSAKTGQNVDNIFINIGKDLLGIEIKSNKNIKLKNFTKKRQEYNSCLQFIYNLPNY